MVGSEKTSVKARLMEVTHQTEEGSAVPLMSFDGLASTSSRGLPFNLQDYLDLVDWTGRCVRGEKRGAIDDASTRILEQLGISDDEWLPTVTDMQSRFKLVIGSPEKMQSHASAGAGISIEVTGTH